MTTPAPEYVPFTAHNGKLVLPHEVTLTQVHLPDEPGKEKSVFGNLVSSAAFKLNLTPKIFTKLPTKSDIIQGQIGDCFLLAALMSIAEMTHDQQPIGSRIIENMMVVNEQDPQYVIVRLYEPASPYTPHYLSVPLTFKLEKVDQKTKKTSLFTGATGQAWVRAIELAFAAFNYGQPLTAHLYGVLDGGHSHEAMAILLGGPAGFATFASNNDDTLKARDSFIDFMHYPFAFQKQCLAPADVIPVGPEAQSSQASATEAEWNMWKNWYTLEKRRAWRASIYTTFAGLDEFLDDGDFDQAGPPAQYQAIMSNLAASFEGQPPLVARFMNYSFLHGAEDAVVQLFMTYLTAPVGVAWYGYMYGQTDYTGVETVVTVERILAAFQKAILVNHTDLDQVGPALHTMFLYLNTYLRAQNLFPVHWRQGTQIIYTDLELNLFRRLKTALSEGRPVAAGSNNRGVTKVELTKSYKGVALGHAHSVFSVSDNQGDLRVLIGNPWQKHTIAYTEEGEADLTKTDKAENEMLLRVLWVIFDEFCIGPTAIESAAGREALGMPN